MNGDVVVDSAAAQRARTERYVVIDGAACTEPMGADKLASYLVTRTHSGAATLQVVPVARDSEPRAFSELAAELINRLERHARLHGPIR